MKKSLIINLFLLICSQSWGQINLVRNPGFETHVNCPETVDFAFYALGWNGIDTNWIPGGTYPRPFCLPDYDNICSTDMHCSIPSSYEYYQYPHKGNGMMGCRFYGDGRPSPIAFDYLQGKLEHILVSGLSYCVTFYVVMANASDYAVNHFGAYLDGGYIDTAAHCYSPQTEYIPQILDTAIISDTLNWIKIQGSFIANGTEKFITIGEFFDTAHIAKIHLTTGNTGYYLVDDVSVIASDAIATAGPDEWMGVSDSTYIGVDSNGDGMPCYWYVLGSTTPIDSGGRIKVRPSTTTSYEVVMDLCGTITRDTVVVHVWPLGVNKMQGEEREVLLYPNPTTGNLTVEGAAGCSVVIYDMVGRVQNCYGMYSCRGSSFDKLRMTGLTMTGIHTITCNKETIDISKLQKGIYIVEVVYEDGERVRRRVVLSEP